MLSARTAINSFPVSNDLVTVVISVDMADSGNRHILIDGVDVSPTWTIYNDDTIDFTILDWSVGAVADDENRINGTVGYLWPEPGVVFNLTVGANIAKFYNTTTSAPEYLVDGI